jgi:hypothetical protein
MIKKIRPELFKKIFCFIIFLFCIPNVSFYPQVKNQARQLVDTSSPLNWTQGYTLILLEENDMYSVNEAKDFITREGGVVAVYSNAHVMIGWIPIGFENKIVGKHGIESIHYYSVDLETLKYADDITLSLVKFFNLVVTGELERQYQYIREQGSPLINDSREHPFVNPEDILNNLENKYVSWDTELVKIAENAGFFPGYSDIMTGSIACCLNFIESDGSIDGNYYTWTTSARDFMINHCLSGASWWAAKSQNYNQPATFYIYYYSPDQSVMKQGYEPILHRSSDDSLWISRIMANLGFSSGTKFDRVTSFNAWLKNYANTQWAYSFFIAYNPTGAPTTFTDGYFAYAYLGGPYAHMLYKNDNWSIDDNWSVYAHETGHIFWACDEYYQAGYGGCTSCQPCNNYRPITNGNCAHPNCNPNAIPCMMKDSSNNLCNYSARQIGWNVPWMILNIQAGSGGTTIPAPGNHEYEIGTNVTVTAVPFNYYIFKNWSGSDTSSTNPISIQMNTNKSLTANFRLIEPPLNFNGQKVLNRSLSQAEYINVLSWQGNPNNADLEISKYRIYLMNSGARNLLIELNPNVFEYRHRMVGRDTSYDYEINVVLENGREGQPAVISIR